MRGGTGGSPEAIVVGGGFAGLAAATALAEAGSRVVVMEARPHLGGRARSWIDPGTGHVVDNGQHLFMGCYAETLRLLSRLGALDRLALQPRLQLPFLDHGGRSAVLRLPPLPAPWNLAAGLLGLRGLSFRERLTLLRVGRDVARRSRRGAGAPADLDDRTVAEWLAGLGQSPAATRRLWFPVAIAALNEEPQIASAACFLQVLREAFHRGAAGSRLGIARVGLSDLYVDPALHYLRAKGCEVRTRTQIRRVLIEGGRCAGVLMPDGTRLAAGAVVAAVPPEELLELLSPGVAAEPAFAGISRLETSPIVSVYLWFGSPITDLPFAGLIGGTWQWLFNRRAFAGSSGAEHGITLVCSAARHLVDRPREQLVRQALEDLHSFVPASRRAALRHALVIKEKRATISPARGALALRPASRTPYRGLHLAGDWIATDLPATIEGAVLSGHACARQTLAER